MSVGLVNGSLLSRALLMLATLPERAVPDAGDCTLSCLGELGSVAVAVAGMRSVLVVDVDVVDVADVLLAVVSAGVVRGAREPTGRSVCAPLGKWVFNWDGGGEIGGIGRAPTRGSLSWGWGTGPAVLAPAWTPPNASWVGDRLLSGTGVRPELELFVIDFLSAICSTHQNNDGLCLHISRLVMKVTGC